jgi:hypothetical protein
VLDMDELEAQIAGTKRATLLVPNCRR